ncbi:hybrid sensor histidine kinase/response regulator [Magnetococcus sp. PR-3]|uniref:hybrid sensor histidine kinase/response regulator n=1 Tax=Magnetococcus sp. PR-3 TaxID=3120355 RepID=UPI002FCE19D2
MSDMQSVIMVVDDERLNINVLNDILKQEHRVKVALSGQQALERAKTIPKPDMILLDIQMPEMDGYEVCRHLKSDLETQDIPIIFITTLTQEEDEKRGLALGAVDYITKPVNPSITLARVNTHLGLKHARESLAERNAELEKMLDMRESIDRITRHDLKTPLHGILGVTDYLLDEPSICDDDKEMIRLQERAGYKMLEMINRSLDMLQMEQGNYRLKPEPVNVVRIIERILDELQQTSASLVVQGVEQAPYPLFHIIGEELLFYSMLANLIKNAHEAQPDGEIVTLILAMEPEPTIRIHNPAVVPAAIQARFFDKYVSMGKSEGTGLGTYSAKLIAQTLGGQIHMHSSEKEGTTITLRFSDQQKPHAQREEFGDAG